MPLYREDLEALGACSIPGCGADHRHGEIFFHPTCHPDSGCWVHYRGDVLTVRCAACRGHVASLVVASKATECRGFDPPDEEAVP